MSSRIGPFAGAASVSLLYLVRLAAPGRRAADGIAAFALFGGLAVVLLALLL